MTSFTERYAERRSLLRRFDTVTYLTIYLILLMGIPSTLQFAPLGGIGAPATVLSGLFFGWYLLAWINPAFTLYRGRQPMRLVGVLWFCVIVTSYALANQHLLPYLVQNGADRGVIIAAGWLGVLLLTADGIDSIDRLRTLLRRIVFGATAMATLGIAQFFTGLDAAKYIIIPGLTVQGSWTDLLSRGSFRRPAATAIHPIEFGVVLALCLPLAVHQARFAPPGLRVRRWLQVALIAATLPMTVSRSAMIAFVVCAIVILPVWPKRDRMLAYFAIVGGLLAMDVVIPGLLGTIRGLFTGAGSDASVLERNKAFALAGPFVAHHPLFGQGFGTFMPQVNFFTDDQYLGSIIETGVFGVLSLVALFVTGWILARRARRMTADDELRHLSQSLAAPAAIALVSYATFDAFAFPMAASLTFLLLGCSAAVWRLIKEDVSAAHDGHSLMPDSNLRRTRVTTMGKGYSAPGFRQ